MKGAVVAFGFVVFVIALAITVGPRRGLSSPPRTRIGGTILIEGCR